METKSVVFVVALVLLSTTALILQATGYFATTWMSYEMKVHTPEANMDLSVDIGLWKTTVCSPSLKQLTNDECKSVSNEELRQVMQSSDHSESSKVAGLNLLDDLETVQALAAIGGLLCIVGKILNFVFIRLSATKKIGIGSAFSWGAGSLLVLTAVLLQSRTDKHLNDGVEMIEHMPEVADKLSMETHFPSAILVSGLGAGLGFFVALLVSVKSFTLQEQEEPGTWKRFNNQAV